MLTEFSDWQNCQDHQRCLKVILDGKMSRCYTFLMVVQKLATFCSNRKSLKVVIARHVTRDKLLLRVVPCNITFNEQCFTPKKKKITFFLPFNLLCDSCGTFLLKMQLSGLYRLYKSHFP